MKTSIREYNLTLIELLILIAIIAISAAIILPVIDWTLSPVFLISTQAQTPQNLTVNCNFEADVGMGL